MTIVYHHRTLGDGAEGIHIAGMIGAFESLGHRVVTCAPGAEGHGRGTVARFVRRALPQGMFECAAAVHNIVERREGRGLLERNRPAFLYKRHALNDVGMLEAARDLGIPSVLEVNALYSSDALQAFEPLRFRKIARRLEARALDAATLVIAVSSPMRVLMQGLAPNARVLTLPNGVDPTQFSPAISGESVRRTYELDGHDLVLGWSGVIRPWHRLDLILPLLASLKSVVLLVVGDGPGRSQVEEQAAALGVRDRVRITGRVPRDEVPRYLAAVDVGVVVDDGTGYASPMKLVEYMAMGKPVVAPDLANIRDIVVDGKHGLLFARGDTAKLQRCVEQLRNEDLRVRLGTNGRERVLSERNWVANATSVLRALGMAAVERPAKAG